MLKAVRLPLAAPPRIRVRPSSVLPLIAGVVLVVVVVVAVFAPRLTPYDPVIENLTDSSLPPVFAHGSWAHPLGTDLFGRDVMARLFYGARVSMSIAALVIFLGATFGSLVGLVAAYYGGVADTILMRLVDLVLSLPIILVAIVVAATLGPSLRNVIIVIAALIWPAFARQIRAEALNLKEQDFVTLARVAGAPDLRIIFRHLLPNVFPTIIVFTTLRIGEVILIEAALSFLGVGVPPPTPTWGGMVADGRAQLLTTWWVSVIPGVAILIVVMSFNILGDWLRDRLDPRTRRIE